MLDAVDDHVFVIGEYDIAVLAHDLDDQGLAAHIAHFVKMVYIKHKDALEGGLAILRSGGRFAVITFESLSDRKVKVDLVEEDGKYYLKTDLFDVVASFRGEPVSTASLGKAFEPDQAFENPDGSPISFDVDYNGEHRAEALPGPFAAASGEIRVL